MKARAIKRQMFLCFDLLECTLRKNCLKMPAYQIASIPGDGIGPEVVGATIQVVDKLAKTLGTFQIEFTHLPWGTAYYKEHGRYTSEDVLDTLRKFDAGIFGSVGAPGMLINGSSDDEKTDHTLRRTGPHLTVGSSSSHSRPTSTIRQCQASAHIPRDQISAQHSDRRDRLGACP